MKRTVSAFLALFVLLSLTALAADEPDPTAVPEPGAHWETVSSGAEVCSSSAGARYVHAWIEIRNTGDQPLYLDATTFEIEDSEGDLGQVLDLVTAFPQVLMPGELGVYEETARADEDLPDEGLAVVSRLEVKPAEVECVRYDVTGFKLKTDKQGNTTGKGRVENGTDKDADGFIYVAALCYDGDGAFMGTIWTIIMEEIPAGERQAFETGSPVWKAHADDIAETVLYAYPDQFQW